MEGETTHCVLVLVFCCALAIVERPYESIQTRRNVALFVDDEETTFVGLQVVFADEVAPLPAIGIGSTLEPTSNETGILAYNGTIIPLGMFEVDWSVDGPRIMAAHWIDADGAEWPIDVASSHARMWFEVPPGRDEAAPGDVPFAPIKIEFVSRTARVCYETSLPKSRRRLCLQHSYNAAVGEARADCPVPE